MEHFDKADFVEAQSAAELRSQLIDRIDAAVIAGDVHGCAEIWSRGAEVMFGWSADEVLGRRVADLVLPAEERELGRAAIADLLAHGSRLIERELLRRDGELFYAYVSTARSR
jgi:PAS domain S-box-containing protein